MAYLFVLGSATFFTWMLPKVEAFRVENPALMFALPLLALFIAWDRRNRADILSTREEVRALSEEDPSKIRPTYFRAGASLIVLTLLAHAFGASVGREAVGLQLGGWSARLRRIRGWHFAACLATGFAIVLGTPFAAAVFVFESNKWKIEKKAWFLIPLVAWVAYRLSLWIGIEHQVYYQISTTLPELLTVSIGSFAYFLALLIGLATLLGSIFLHSIERLSRRTSSWGLAPLYLVGVVAIFYLYGFSAAEELGLPGLGISILNRLTVLEPSQVVWFTQPMLLAFLKIALTAGFVGIGVRGGELTPLLVSGAMLAVGLGILFGFPVSSLVALGFPLVWGIAARRPVAAGILAVEVFGLGGWGALGLVTGAAVYAGMKLGDFVDARFVAVRLSKNKDPGVWRRGLYD